MRKHWVWMALALALTGAAHAQETAASDDLFAGADKFKQGSSGSSEVTLDKGMLGFAGKGIADKMDYVYVRSYEYPRAGMYRMADVEQFEKKLDASGCKHVVRAKEDNELSDICVKTDNEGHWREMIVISADPMELNFVHLKGSVSLQDLSKLSELGSSGVLGNGQKAAQPAPDPKLHRR